MKSRFDEVFVIGFGKTAGDVLAYVARRQSQFGYRATFIEHELTPMSRFRTMCRELGAAYEQIPEKNRVTERFEGLRSPALIISAGNYYLFPRTVLEKENLEIINFHNALLPKFPGRNAQSWAIWEGEKRSGATWHYVTAEVDSGAVLAQSETPLTEDIRAYELTRDIMEKATEAFESFYEQLLIRHIEGRPQPKAAGPRRIYYSRELPGGGVCAAGDPPETIYRMLRAMDYGKNGIFPPVRLRLDDGREAAVLRYKKTEPERLKDGPERLLDSGEKRLYLKLDGGHELALRLDI